MVGANLERGDCIELNCIRMNLDIELLDEILVNMDKAYPDPISFTEMPIEKGYGENEYEKYATVLLDNDFAERDKGHFMLFKIRPEGSKVVRLEGYENYLESLRNSRKVTNPPQQDTKIIKDMLIGISVTIIGGLLLFYVFGIGG